MREAVASLKAAIQAVQAARDDLPKDDPNDGELRWIIADLTHCLAKELVAQTLAEGMSGVMHRILAEAGAKLSKDSKAQINQAISSLNTLMGIGSESDEPVEVSDEEVAEVAEGLRSLIAELQEAEANATPAPGSEPNATPATSTPSEVVPVESDVVSMEGLDQLRESVLILSEAGPRDGSVFRTLVIKAGMSLNRVNYRPDVLRESVGLLEGKPIYVDHPPMGSMERSIRDKVGWWENAAYETGLKDANGNLVEGIVANMHLYRNSGQPWFRDMVNEAMTAGRPQDIGISIVAGGIGKLAKDAEGVYKEVEKIQVFASADAVAEPGAGGQPLKLVASTRKDIDVNLEGLTFAEITASHPELTIAQVREARPDLFNEDGSIKAVVAEVTPPTPPVADPPAEPMVSQEAFAGLQQGMLEMRRASQRMILDQILRESGLPAALHDRLRTEIGTTILSEAELRERVDGYVQIIQAAVPQASNGMPSMPGTIIPYGSVNTGLSMQERLQYSLDRWFGADVPDTAKDVPYIRSFREYYVGVTGDVQFNGRYQPEFSWVREALPGATHIVGGGTITMSNLLGTSMNRALVKQYQGQRRWWEPIVQKSDLQDMKQQDRVRLHAFGSLTERTVDGAEYTELDWGETPEDFTPTEYGNLVTVGRRAIINDNLNGIRRLPQLMAQSAVITLNEYVSALFTANSGNGPTLNDTVQVFNAASHQGNRVTTAMSRTSVIDLMKVMMKFNNDASKRIGVEPRYLLGPVDLIDTMYELTRSQQVPDSANNAPNFVADAQFGLRSPIVVPQWTDTNNWYLMADPSQIVGIELGFLFGQETPTLMEQMDPTSGLVWTNDAISFKVRWDFGGGWLDYRAAAASIVA